MSKTGKEFKSNFFSRGPQFQYIPEDDKFLLALPKPKYRFNVIGTGIMGMEHMRLTALEGRGMIHGIYDTNPLSVEKAKQMFAIHFPGNPLKEYSSLQEACNDPEADALLICTPNFTHIQLLETALASGKHVLMEKPMATTVKDAFAMMNAGKKHKKVFQVGLQYRYKAIYVESIHEALERSAVGDIKLISIMEHRIPFLDKVGQWNKFSKYSGGTLVEKCCHYFDLLNLFARSRPKEVYASGSMAVNFKDFQYKGEKSDILDNALVTVTYENGVRGSFNLCMFSPLFYEEIVICGDEGRLCASETEDFMSAGRPKCRMEIMRGERMPSKITTPIYPKYIEESGHNGATYYEHVRFVDSIEGARSNTATVEEGFWAVVVGAAAEESAHTGKVVAIRELLERNGISI